MNKDIHILFDQITFIPHWDRTLEQNRCPIQIIEEGNTKWISLLNNIDFKYAAYKNVILFQIGECLVINDNDEWIHKLMEGKQYANFADGDIIRNPTMEEYIIIARKLKEHGIIFNKKRNH